MDQLIVPVEYCLNIRILSKYSLPAMYKVIKHQKNMGKGTAIRTGIQAAKGDYIVIQDADLEYHPKDIKKLLDPMIKGDAHVVYGSRLKRLPNFRHEERTIQFFIHYIGNKFLSLLTSLLYGQWITDMETGYKVFPRNAFADTPLLARGFELEPEITAKLLKKGYTIHELRISTIPRGYNEGKKLHTLRDGLKAFITLLYFRFME
jgi:dolichol-phosphate mannosyltransferase